MKLEVNRDRLAIFPENEADVAFIEDTLKLRADGAELRLVRVDATAMGLGSKACLEARARKEEA